MRPVMIGAVVAVAIVGAFAIGYSLTGSEPDGPAESAGAALDEAVRDIERGIEDATD